MKINEKQRLIYELQYPKELVDEYELYINGKHCDYLLDEEEDDVMNIDEFVELVIEDNEWEQSEEFERLIEWGMEKD